MSAPLETATIGGGCFWCTEAVFEMVRGVKSVVSGYAGGHVPNPSYEEVCGKKTGHAEVVQITFDPAEIAYDVILGIFFATHDPTTPNQQGADVGPQYRSVIYYHTEEQKQIAERVIEEVTKQKIYPKPIVTEVAEFSNFYPAEQYHQGYYRSNPGASYCAFVVGPKVAKFRKHYRDWLKSSML